MVAKGVRIARIEAVAPILMAMIFGMLTCAHAAPSTAEVVRAVEYYHQAFEHYFVTADPVEIAALDSGAVSGWWRTGQRYRVDTAPAEGLVPVCRFYTAAYAGKGSHFFTASAVECAVVKTMPDWTYEGVAFYARLSDAQGNCEAGTTPVYRLFNGGQGDAPNHAYTADAAKRKTLIAAKWVPEGVAYCAPLATEDPLAMLQLLAGSTWQFTDFNGWQEETHFELAPAVNEYGNLATQYIADWGYQEPAAAIFHHFEGGDGPSWVGVATWNALSGDYVVLSLDNFDGYWIAWAFNDPRGTTNPVCTTQLSWNFDEVMRRTHPFQPTLSSGCHPGTAIRR